MEKLPEAPRRLVDERGAPHFGAFEGRVYDTSLRPLAGRFRRTGLARLASEKRWYYACVSSPSLVLAASVVNLGYAAGGFFYVFDRRNRRMLAERTIMPALVNLDDNAAETRATLRRVRTHFLLEASRLGGRLVVSLPGKVLAEIILRPEGAPEALTAICPVSGDRVAMTQKSSCIPATGEIRVGPSTYRLQEAFASLDYSHGYLLRKTHWRWASGCGRLDDGRVVGINLVEGHNDGPVTENALWIDGRLSPLGRARFELSPEAPLSPWRLRTEDGRVDLRFDPEGLRRESFEYRVFASQYVQPIGAFTGTVLGPDGERVEVKGLPGVTENHHSLW
ncbi:MAG: DUF2804 domain-containing protein [Myxococcales bacterium]|jgi:hypothetical protein